jgi:hypothetical protein
MEARVVKLVCCDLLELLPSLDVVLDCCTAHLDHLGVLDALDLGVMGFCAARPCVPN